MISGLRKEGIPILRITRETGKTQLLPERVENRSYFTKESLSAAESTILGHLGITRETPPVKFSLSDEEFESEDESVEVSSITTDDAVENLRTRDARFRFRIHTDDFFEVVAAKAYCEDRNLPFTVDFWPGDTLRITDQIRPGLIKLSSGSRALKRPILLHELKDDDALIRFIFSHTFWGKYLVRDMFDEESKSRNSSRQMVRRIGHFLRGKADPIWSKPFREQVYGVEYELRDTRTRFLRLVEVCKTIDGVFCQRFLAFPEEVWDWSQYDRFVLNSMWALLTDEFYDGEIDEDSVYLFDTEYERLKASRNYVARHRDPALVEREKFHYPQWLSYMHTYEDVLKEEADQDRYTRILGILCQTRGCGTPPPVVVTKTRLKFLEVVTEDPSETPLEQLDLIRRVTEQIANRIPDHCFTGLSTKAAVTITTSASFEKNRDEGGTLEAIRELVQYRSVDKGVEIYDLYTGAVEKVVDQSTLSAGEYVFWRCLKYVLCTPPYELRKTKLVVVSEPGKARAVTKSCAYLKIVLDVVNKLCSWPLKKGLESSASGMGKSAHGWNFFREISGGSMKHLVFDLKYRKYLAQRVLGEDLLEETFHDVYVSSTDYSTATDYLQHDIAANIAEVWMLKCGIPPMLRGIVHETCYKPRTVIFSSKSVLKRIGEKYDANNNYVTLKRGVLMGDPLTKVVLHLVNAGVRHIGNNPDIW
jgi:hypothetical protein